MNSLENHRKELGELCRELLLLDGDIEKLQKKLSRIEQKRNEIYLEIDKKMDE